MLPNVDTGGPASAVSRRLCGRLRAEVLGPGPGVVHRGFIVVLEQVEDVRADPEDGVRLRNTHDPGPTTMAPQANAQPNAMLRIQTRSTLLPHGQQATEDHPTTRHYIVASVTCWGRFARRGYADPTPPSPRSRWAC